jgi:hypothetical protein
VRILFSALTPLSLTTFQSVIRALAERGHVVTIAIHETRTAAWRDSLLAEIAREAPGVDVEYVPAPARDPWLALAGELRSARDLFQFLDARFGKTYRARATRRAPRSAAALARLRFGRTRPFRRLMLALIGLAERAVPPNAEIEEYLRRHEPDVVLFTPYMGLRTAQPDFLQAAQALGIRTGICVKSWDNLSSKSIIRPIPDRVFVWNEVQREEAMSLHSVPRDRVAVTGAQCFDEWFSWPPRPRNEFARRIGIDPDRPYLLYVCSAPWTKQTEVEFVRRWVQSFRAAGGALAETSVVVRPHPKRPQEWPGADLSDLGEVVVYPREPTPPTDHDSKADYFDSIHHSAAVVGLNTSAMIEAAIIGRPVLTVLEPEFEEVQTKTLHFRYLLEVGGGVLRVAHTHEEHARQLAAVLAGEDVGERERAFVRDFIRPHGLDVEATPVFVDEIERLAAAPAPAARKTPLLLAPVRWALKPVAGRLGHALPTGG